MNIHHVKMATDFTDALRAKGRRKKARAFWEYFYDVETGESNARSFYAQSWSVSKSTAHEWLIEFEEQYKIFTAAMKLINDQKNSHAKKQTERLPNDERTKRHPQSTTTPSLDENSRTLTERLPNEALNIYDDDKEHFLEKNFRDLFFIYSVNTSKVGDKFKAYDEYIRLDHTNINHKDLVVSAVMYLHDKSRDGKYYNLANFLKNETYLAYMTKTIRVFFNDVWVVGSYDSTTQIFTDVDGNKAMLTSDVLAAKFAKGELEFIKERAVA